MNNNQDKNQEIDLVYLFRKIKELFFNIGLLIYKSIRFLKKNFIIISGLIIIGYAIGYFVERSFSHHENSELLVAPNFKSVDYLYKEIEIINSTKHAYKELEGLVKVSVKPVYSIDDLLLHSGSDSEQKQLFVNSYFENSEKIKKEMSDDNLKSLFNYHIISFETNNNESSKRVGDYILQKLNRSSYFDQKKQFEQKNLIEKKKQLAVSIDQINNLLNSLGNTTLKDEKGVNINTYSELSKLVDTKSLYVDQLSDVDTQILQSKSTIYLIKESLNIEKVTSLSNNYKLIFPTILLLCFALFNWYRFLKNKYHQYI
ncbi:hypothetical protein [Empedobacter sedimenti]|uniref:hypothetical protein n=1 Tax=Empedobacter sedimenti TaxID=3042610 RepID=UPI0024A741A0|nr:hypothetical protein [Empedobacter sedimenti]